MRKLARHVVSLLTLALATGAAADHAMAAPPAVAATVAADAKRLARSDNAFAIDLLQKLKGQKGNLALSPFSIATALEMAAAGAKGETLAQMKRVLHLDGANDVPLDVAGALVSSYAASSNGVTIKVANRLFGERSFAFERPYLARMQGAFGAPLESVDFVHRPEDARGRINGWVAGATNDRIKELVPAGGVTDDTRLVLGNAIYFLGDWANAFEKEQTRSAPFSTSGTATKQVPTMHATETFAFATAPGVKILDLPYRGGTLAMTVVLPDAVDGLDAVTSKLTPAALDGWVGALRSTRVSVALPKLEIDPAAPLSLAPVLASLGMPLAFDARQADFTGLANPANPRDRLFVSAVFHKAFVKVDEKGTEAAAATGVVMARPTAVLVQPPLQSFQADHPFLFFIRDTRTNLILFAGKVADPAAK
jgi:serpin B